MKIKQYLLSLSCIILVGISFLVFATCDPSISSCASGTALPACTGGGCFPTAAAKHAYEVSHNCTFATGTCHLANGEDIFRWAIGKRESGVFGYSTPDVNPCNAGNFYCAATTGNPASAGRTNFYAASYGPQQLTPQLLIQWLNPNGATLFNPPPDCLKHDFLDDAAMMDALRDANARRIFGEGVVRNRTVPAATVNGDGSITYPAVPASIRQTAINLKIIRIGDPASETEWEELWQRMATWERVRQVVTARWNVDSKTNVWIYLRTNAEFITLANRLGMEMNNHKRTGLQTYVKGLGETTPIWGEAVAGFGSYALFSGSSELYARMMNFFASGNCYITAVKQMFKLTNYGYDGNHADPADSVTENWVKKAACAWNTGSPSLTCSYVTEAGNNAWLNYKYYYNHYYGVTEVCN
jgi:hypothetical protein